MSDGVRNGGSVFAGAVDPKQSETYLSVRKILVHRMMPANPPTIDDDERTPSFSTVLSGVNESLDDLCKNMRWRAERLQDTSLPGATRASFPGPRASPATQLMARVAEEGPNNQYPNRFDQYAAAPALEPRANSDGRLPPLKQLENGHRPHRGEGGSHPTTRREEMAPPSARSAASSVIQHDVWMTSRVSQLLQELDGMKDKMKPRLERGHKLHALRQRLDSMEQGRAHSHPHSYASSHVPNSYANSHAPDSEVGHGVGCEGWRGGGSSLPSIHEREGGRGKGAAGKVLTPRARGGAARRGEVASEGQEAPSGRVPAKKRQLNRGGVAVHDSGDEAAEGKGGAPARGGRRERGAGQRGGVLPIAAHPVRRK